MQYLSSKDFYSTTKFNSETKDQLWMSIIADSHDIHCDCDHPFAHLLANLFPPGHKDRLLSINQILHRDYIEKCRSGGNAGESHGMADGGGEEKPEIKPEEEDFPGDEVEELLAAAIKEEER